MTRCMLLFLIACLSIYRPLLTGEDDSECLLSKSSEPLLGFIDANDNRRSDLTNIEAEPLPIFSTLSVSLAEYIPIRQQTISSQGRILYLSNVFIQAENMATVAFVADCIGESIVI